MAHSVKGPPRSAGQHLSPPVCPCRKSNVNTRRLVDAWDGVRMSYVNRNSYGCVREKILH